MLIAHILVVLIPGVPTPILTGQIFESEAACEDVRTTIVSNDKVNQYVCAPVLNSTPNR